MGEVVYDRKPPTMSSMDENQLISDWLIGSRARTRRDYRTDIAQFQDFIDKPILEGTRTDIKRWLAHLGDLGRSDSTIRRKASAVSSFYTEQVREGRIAANPAEAIKRPGGESDPRQGLPLDQAHRLIAAAREHSRPAAALIGLTAGVGLRINEALSARIEDLRGEELTVMVKGGHRQTKPLSPPVLAAIQSQIGDRETGPIVTHHNGTTMSYSTAWRLVNELATKAAIDDISPHVLRHTAATLALAAGARTEDVQELLGHRSIETTLGYLRGRDKRAGARSAAQLLGETLYKDLEEGK